jgi:hypothetical protein
VHHFDNDDFDAVFLVNYTELLDTELLDTTGPVTEDDDAYSDQDMSNTKPDTDDDDNADARSRIFKVQDPDYDKFRLLSGWMHTKTIKKILEQTTQYARMPNGTIIKKHYKSSFPALNLQRRDERVTTDTVYSNAPDTDWGETCAQIFVDTETLVTDVYGIKTVKQFVNTLEDNIRERGALSRLLSDRAQVEISVCVVGIFHALHIGQWQREPHQQHQNPCKCRYQTLKTMMHTLLDRSGSPGSTWLLCLLYFAVLLKLTYNWALGGIPLQCAEGSTQDISPLLRFYWWEPVYFKVDDAVFPSIFREEQGHFVGISTNVGHAMTYRILV